MVRVCTIITTHTVFTFFMTLKLKMFFSSKISLKTDDIFVPIKVLSRLCAKQWTVNKNLNLLKKIKIFYFLFP